MPTNASRKRLGRQCCDLKEAQAKDGGPRRAVEGRIQSVRPGHSLCAFKKNETDATPIHNRVKELEVAWPAQLARASTPKKFKWLALQTAVAALEVL